MELITIFFLLAQQQTEIKVHLIWIRPATERVLCCGGHDGMTLSRRFWLNARLIRAFDNYITCFVYKPQVMTVFTRAHAKIKRLHCRC